MLSYVSRWVYLDIKLRKVISFWCVGFSRVNKLLQVVCQKKFIPIVWIINFSFNDNHLILFLNGN